MSAAKGLMLCAALLLCTSAEALAHSRHSHMDPDELPSKVYRTYGHCSASKRIDLNRLQPGEMAIMIQDRGFRTGVGFPLDQGECW